MSRRRVPYSPAELEEGALIWEHLHSLPVAPPPSGASHRELRLSGAAARLVVMWALAANSTATDLGELEDETRRRIESAAGVDLRYDVHALRRSLFAAFAAAGARWGERRAGGGARTPLPELAPWIDPLVVERAVAVHLERNATQHECVRTALEGGAPFSVARAKIELNGRRSLRRALFQLALPVAGASTLAEDARQPYPHFCRCCGDATCRSHCRRSVLGEHISRPGERTCSRCGIDADPGESNLWSAFYGSPASWAAPRPLTPEEEAFEQAFEAMIEMAREEGSS